MTITSPTDARKVMNTIIALWKDPRDPIPSVDTIERALRAKRLRIPSLAVRSILRRTQEALGAYRHQGGAGVTRVFEHEPELVILALQSRFAELYDNHKKARERPAPATPKPVYTPTTLPEKIAKTLAKVEYAAPMTADDVKFLKRIMNAHKKGGDDPLAREIASDLHLQRRISNASDTIQQRRRAAILKARPAIRTEKPTPSPKATRPRTPASRPKKRRP
ncbi:MAG: hypothetical protein IPJ89_00540 [Candidatus Iainarchaeum archaeon]|uniref:Uncharacterized protein n=1 Tax=Candidatus Iainarchaeum sp. TaxID=3101447 RepID=A0A7T9I173_9ARCH|nr:MAG: hypothetical protein IPJ89_00540 [Candidatus Diapherotrites archaeon]